MNTNYKPNDKNLKAQYKPSGFIIDGPFKGDMPKIENEPITHIDMFDRSLIGRIVATPEMSVQGSLENMDIFVHYFHELNHYIQDLSLTSCIAEGDFKDKISTALIVLSNEKGLFYPLMKNENRLHNQNALKESQGGEMFKALEDIYDVYHFIYKKAHHKPQTTEYDYNSPNEHFFEHFALSYNDLLECYAYVKSYHDLFTYVRTEEEIGKVNQYLNANNVFPFVSEGKQFGVDINLKEFNKALPSHFYHTAQLLFMAAMPENWGEIIRYYHEDCPKNFHGSMAEMTLIELYLTLEVALNIPDCDYILEQVTTEKVSKEFFSPVHRFYKVIKTIRDNGGFPDAVEGIPFYFTFFNWVANQNGWPIYEKTFNRILSSLSYRFEKYHEAVTSLQTRVLSKKLHGNPHHFFAPPAYLAFVCGLPLISRNAKQLELVHVLGNMIKESTGLADMYHTYFGEIRKANIEKDMEAIVMNGVAMLRETACRIMSHCVQQALLRKGVFRCPFGESDCPMSNKKCKQINDIFSVGEYCKLLILRSEKVKMLLTEELGNMPNCMLLNYLLDYNYNIQNIKETWTKR